MARGIQLVRSELQNANHLHIHGFRLRIEVGDVNGDMPRHVFVYRRNPPHPVTGDIEDTFMTVASFVDISEFPAEAPGNDSPYFRKDFIEVDVRSTRDFDAVWSLIHAQVCELVSALNRADLLIVTETTWCGEAATASDSSASSA